MYILLRPGPYTCAEWDFGGLPSWFLKYDDIKVRSYDQKYLSYVERYIKRLSEIVVSKQITNGGPIIMVQIENEFGLLNRIDHAYIDYLQKLWIEVGIIVPFYTADGLSIAAQTNGHVIGGAIGLDSGTTDWSYKMATSVDSKVVSFSSETYPGWLTHWGEQWARKSTDDAYNEIKFILDYGKSFSIYVVHGGTNFGFWAGANDENKGYQPHVTSYDYDAPLTENGNTTDKYYALRNLIKNYVTEPMPDVPEPIKSMQIPKVDMKVFTTIWDNEPIANYAEFPKFFEFFDQFSGAMIYRTNLTQKTSGNLEIQGLKDYALVFVDDVFIGTLDRSQAIFNIALPDTGKIFSKLEIVVEGMGRINFGSQMIDRKGINGNVTLDGNVVSGWAMINLPFDDSFVANLKERSNKNEVKKQGVIFKGSFFLDVTADSFIDVSQWEKGMVFVNGKNLGRYWNIGPQYRLYCPASYFKQGENIILILDFHLTSQSYITGQKILK